MPPFGFPRPVRAFVDADLLQYDHIEFKKVRVAAETWNDNFGANQNDIARVTGGVITDLKRI